MLTVATWHPPFHPCSLSSFGSVQQVNALPGDMLLVRYMAVHAAAANAAEEEPGITPLVRDIRRRYPACPVALWIAEAPPQAVINAVRSGTHAQIRAIIGGNSPDPQRLRIQFTQPQDLSSFVLRWASDAGYLSPEMEQEDVRKLLDAPANVRTLERLARHSQVAARTWRNRLQQLGLPTPRAWLGLAHALRTAFFVQRHPTEPLESLCEKLGLYTVGNMSQQFKRTFSLAPGKVRELLGAEPLLDQWFRTRSPR